MITITIIIIIMVTLYNKIHKFTLVNKISKHELRLNNTSTAFVNLTYC